MSAKKVRGRNSMQQTARRKGREASLHLPTDKVTAHKNGIEFHCAEPFKEWTEMTVIIDSVTGRGGFSAAGIVVGCVGNPLVGFNISLLFTNLNPKAQKKLSALYQSEIGHF